ncbi:MAG TPA: VCBS repeat-containing protein, partial [Candidatus Angelobacter sp.]|nr:VCBS repeat-containing protein [Candidatus Angelobacter sp.]
FYLNRHAIAADGTALSGYSAFFNLVLSDAPCYGFLCHDHEQDFDMHGSDPSSHHTGGYGGGAVEIARNTFLGVNRRNFDLRGQACALDEFHNNISRQSAGDAIRWFVPSHPFSLSGDQVSPPNSPPAWLDIRDNRFNSQDPTQHLGVGDFDGDGKDDLFLATGAAWYYAPAGKAEWRFLSAKTEQIGALLFGDFDGDGRTDVFTQYGRDWLISWGGISPWEKINESDARMSDFAIGDFDGDHRADVFYANGHEWYVSYGGVGPFIHIAFAIHRAPDLRFGDFNGDGKTDVFGVVGDYWMVVYGETQYWAPLRPKLTDTVADLIVADFDGDGRADIATSSRQDIFNWGNWVWKVSRGGISDWTTLRTDGLPLASVAAIGRFDESAGADVLLWNSRWLDIVSSGTATPQPYTTQQMR